MTPANPKPARAARKPAAKTSGGAGDEAKPARAPRGPRVRSTPEVSETPAPPAPRTRRTPTAKAQAAKAPADEVQQTVPVPNSRPVVVDPDAYPGESRPGEASDNPFKLTVNIPQSLYERAAGLIWHADFTGGPEEVTSMTSLVRLALVDTIAKYEQKYNAGMAFPPPARLRRGRAPKLR